MKINWTVRLKNKTFWVSAVAISLSLFGSVASLFGWIPDLGELGNKLVAIIDTIFMGLGLLGVVADPTTKGLSDSDLAMTYTEPKDDATSEKDGDGGGA